MNEYTTEVLYQKEYGNEHGNKQNSVGRKKIFCSEKSPRLNKREGIKRKQDKGSCEQILSASVV